MGGVSNNYNLDLQKLQGQQGTTKTVNRTALQKDSRLSMNGSIFSGKMNNSSGTSSAGTTQSVNKDYSDVSTSEAKSMKSSSQAQASSYSSDMDAFALETASYRAAAQGDMSDSVSIQKDLNKETKALNKAQKN